MRRLWVGSMRCFAAILLAGVFAGAAAAAPKTAPGKGPAEQGALRLNRRVMMIRLDKGYFEVVEFLDLENTGKTPIVSKNGAPTLRITLPRSDNIRNPNALDWGIGRGLDPKKVQRVGDEILSFETIPPGPRPVMLFYKFQDEFGGIWVERPVRIGTTNFAILPEKGRVQMQAGGMRQLASVKFQDRELDRYVGAAPAGTTMRIHLMAPSSMADPTYFYMAAGGLAVFGGVLGLWIRKRRNASLLGKIEREKLLISIAELDDRLALGKIASEAHREERGARFARLRELS